MSTSNPTTLRFPALGAFIIASSMSALAVWVFFQDQGKNILSTFPLFWLIVLVCAPPVSAVCTVAFWREQARARWVACLATVLAIVQLLAWAFIVMGILHYS